MTQRIFDTDNADDMALLWSILPDGIIKISPNNLAEETSLWSELNLFTLPIGLIKINWHDKKEITRPIQEATEADIGKICYFWDKEKSGCYEYGELLPSGMNRCQDFPYTARNGRSWQHARRLTKQEIEELC